MKRCLICFHDIYHKVSFLHYFDYRDCICENCRNEMEIYEKWIQIEDLKVFCIYHYNRFMESLLFQFKEGRDIALKSIFFHQYIQFIEKQFKGYTLVYMPSSKEHLSFRGFYPLLEMLEKISLNKMDLFVKTENYKQSMQRYEDRKNVRNVIFLREKVTIPEKILLVDDVITSGETLLAAYHLLEGKAKEIKGMVLCENYTNVELCDEKKFSFAKLIDILKT